MTRQGMSISKRIIIASLLIIAAASRPVAGLAQDPPPTQTPKSPEVLALEEEKARATLKKEIAEAERAERVAKFPPPSSTALEGKTTINDAAIIESQMMAYVSMAKAANRIVTAIKARNLTIGSLAIYNERDVNLLLSYKVATGQVEALYKQFCDVICPPAVLPTASPSLAPLTIAQSLLGGFVDLTSFLRTNVEIKGQTFSINEGPLVSEVYRAARRPDGLPNIRMYYPFVFPPDINPATTSPILSRIRDVRDLRVAAAKFISDVGNKDQDIAKAKAKVDQLKGGIEQLDATQQDALKKAQRILEAYCPAIARAEFRQPPPSNPPNPDPGDPQVDAVLYRIRMVEAGRCRTIPPEKREELFEMRDVLNQTVSDKREAAVKLTAANVILNRLGQDRRNFSGRLHDPNMNIDDAIALLKASIEQFDKFVTSIIQADATVGINPLTSYIRAENIQAALNPSGSNVQPGTGYWLQLTVLSAGGNNRIKTNLIIDIFTGGNRLSHSGGAIVQYALFNGEGRIVASDTITEYTDYIRANRIKKLPCARVDDLGAGANEAACVDR